MFYFLQVALKSLNLPRSAASARSADRGAEAKPRSRTREESAAGGARTTPPGAGGGGGGSSGGSGGGAAGGEGQESSSRLSMWANIRDRMFGGGASRARLLNLTIVEATFHDTSRNQKLPLDAFIEIRNITTGQVRAVPIPPCPWSSWRRSKLILRATSPGCLRSLVHVRFWQVETTSTVKKSYKPKYNQHFVFKTKQNANDMIMMKIMEHSTSTFLGPPPRHARRSAKLMAQTIRDVPSFFPCCVQPGRRRRSSGRWRSRLTRSTRRARRSRCPSSTRG